MNIRHRGRWGTALGKVTGAKHKIAKAQASYYSCDPLSWSSSYVFPLAGPANDSNRWSNCQPWLCGKAIHAA